MLQRLIGSQLTHAAAVQEFDLEGIELKELNRMMERLAVVCCQ